MLEAAEPSLLRYAWLGGAGDDLTTVTYRLEPHGDGTRFTWEHTGFAGIGGLAICKFCSGPSEAANPAKRMPSVRPRGRMKRLSALAASLVLAYPLASHGESSLLDDARKSLAVVNGQLAVPGLMSPVRVLRDRWGVAPKRSTTCFLSKAWSQLRIDCSRWKSGSAQVKGVSARSWGRPRSPCHTCALTNKRTSSSIPRFGSTSCSMMARSAATYFSTRRSK